MEWYWSGAVLKNGMILSSEETFTLCFRRFYSRHVSGLVGCTAFSKKWAQRLEKMRAPLIFLQFKYPTSKNKQCMYVCAHACVCVYMCMNMSVYEIGKEILLTWMFVLIVNPLKYKNKTSLGRLTKFFIYNKKTYYTYVHGLTTS